MKLLSKGHGTDKQNAAITIGVGSKKNNILMEKKNTKQKDIRINFVPAPSTER